MFSKGELATADKGDVALFQQAVATLADFSLQLELVADGRPVERRETDGAILARALLGSNRASLALDLSFDNSLGESREHPEQVSERAIAWSAAFHHV